MTFKYHLWKLHIFLLPVLFMICFCCCSVSPENSSDTNEPFITYEPSAEISAELPETSPSVSAPIFISQSFPADMEVSETDNQSLPSLLDFLQIAIQPACQTMYVWGGGWNEENTGAGIEAVTLGVSPRWAEFAAEQTSAYDHRKTRYRIHDGLDCSGYVGWAVYNVLEKENKQEGYVIKSTHMAQSLAERGLGEYLPASEVTNWLPGDICSMKSHVWISLGMCSDNSVLLLHASPPGVIFSGTLLPDGSVSEAVKLAEQITQTCYPDWYEKFPVCSRSHSYLTNSSVMRWSQKILSDKEEIGNMNAAEIVKLLFGESQ